MPDHELTSYPVFESPEHFPGSSLPDAEYDLTLPNVREKLLGSALVAMDNNLPLLPAARDALLIDRPDLAAKLGLRAEGSEGEQRVPVEPMTFQEHEALQDRLQTSGVIGTGERHFGVNGQALSRRDYEGSLGGGTPKNALQIPGIVHH